MKSKTLPPSRKQPVQVRSRQTVRAILEATSQVLVQRGYEGTTTGAVVERAGVSIGTLYQYFPNKESLVAALIEEHVADVLALVKAALDAHASGPAEALLEAVIRASIDAHRLNPALHKVLSEQVPREGKLASALNISDRISGLIEGQLGKRFPRVTAPRIRLIAFVIETTVEALTHRAVVERPEWLATGALEIEARRLLVPYVQQLAEEAGGLPQS